MKLCWIITFQKKYIFLGYPNPGPPPPRLCPLKGRFFCQISEQNWEVPPFPLTEGLQFLSQKNFPQKGQKWTKKGLKIYKKGLRIEFLHQNNLISSGIILLEELGGNSPPPLTEKIAK